MILTGKALTAYLIYATENYPHIEDMSDIALYALIVNWLDSVGIYICITPIFQGTQIENGLYGYSYNIGIKSFTNRYTTRHEATEAAIVTANKLFNER